MEKYQNKSRLEFEYWWNKRSMKQIGEKCSVSGSTIRNWLIKFGINIKTFSQAGKNYYEYLCYKCHKIKDGTIYNIKNQEGLYN